MITRPSTWAKLQPQRRQPSSSGFVEKATFQLRGCDLSIVEKVGHHVGSFLRGRTQNTGKAVWAEPRGEIDDGSSYSGGWE